MSIQITMTDRNHFKMGILQQVLVSNNELLCLVGLKQSYYWYL